jgi:hypothetical protein
MIGITGSTTALVRRLGKGRGSTGKYRRNRPSETGG